MSENTQKILHELRQSKADEAVVDRAVRDAVKAVAPLKTQNRQARQGRVR